MMKKTINRPYRQQTEKPHLCGSVVDLPETKPLTAFEVFHQLRAPANLPETKQDECTLVNLSSLSLARLEMPTDLPETKQSMALGLLSLGRWETPAVRPTGIRRNRDGNVEFEFGDGVSEEDARLYASTHLADSVKVLGISTKAMAMDLALRSARCDSMVKINSHVGNTTPLHSSIFDFGVISEVYPDDAPKVRSLNEIAQSPRLKRPLVRAASTGDEDREVTSQRLMKAARIVAREHREELKALVNQ